ncbi:hypothetical protein [Algibacter aquimarinus]|uniref:Riboflavin synthase subunit alpha n=1 Tax=Algibacter aquimarinus TaxID=1136748 RepID=A0ABP9H997_9FLAO
MDKLNLKKENELKRKNKSLTHNEWMTFFFLPFLTPKPNHRNDDFSQSELDRFKKYGFDKKIKEASKAKKQGLLFWLVMILITISIITFWKK